MCIIDTLKDIINSVLEKQSDSNILMKILNIFENM